MAFNLFMHERNIYKERPDFKKIATDYPEFRIYAVPDMRGRIHIDFNDQNALRALTKILLKKDFNLDVTIPDGFLIPTVPQRLNYLLWIEDLLDLLPKRSFPLSGIDIGTGPCAIFSLLGAKKNDWNFVATETSDEAIQWAEKNIKANNLESHIKVVQVSKDSILEEVLSADGKSYDFCLCNPPFFENIEEIKRRSSKAKETLATTAKKDEILAEGGEVTFVKNMIRDSLIFKDRICLYTSMFGRKKSFIHILKELQNIKDISYTKTEFCQGNTIRWGVAWTFLDSVNLQKVERPKAKKPKKAKPPLLHKISCTKKGVSSSVRKLSKWMQESFIDLEILFKVVKSAENYAEIQITTDKNTWSNQRRKRREVRKDKEEPSTKDSGKIITPVINEIQVTANESESSPSIISDFSPLGDSTSSQAITVSKKRKVEDDNNLESSPAQKLKTEDHENTKSLGKSSVCSQPQTVIAKGKRESEDPSEVLCLSSAPQELKVDTNVFADRVVPDFQYHCSQNQPESGTIEENSEDTSNQRKREQSSSGGDGIDRDIKDKQKADVTFEPKSLLFCILKIRKGEDHLLLEMNCPPEANRESMHQIFQFLKNKLANG